MQSRYKSTQTDKDFEESYENYPKDNVAWDDLTNSLIARRLESTAGKLNYDYDENCVVMQSGGSISNKTDRLIFNLQKPHAMSNTAPNNTMNLHIHWEQPDATEREFTVQYRVQSNGEEKVTAWTTVTVSSLDNNVFEYASGTLEQITSLVNIDLSQAGLSATVQFRLARTDSNSGDINATFVDAHIPYDQLGSRQQFTK